MMPLMFDYLMVFMRLTLGRLEQDLEQRFCVSVSSFKRVVIYFMLNVLVIHLKNLVVWTRIEVIAGNVP